MAIGAALLEIVLADTLDPFIFLILTSGNWLF
jgi:hypothetical protein